MPPAARITDMHFCPMVTGVVPHVGGLILPPGEPTVLIGMFAAACMTDMATCVGPPAMIMMGSPTVLIGGLMAARMGDPTVHGGVIVLGEPTVMIGEVGMGSPVVVTVQPVAGRGAGAGPASAAKGAGVRPVSSAAMETLAQAMGSVPAQALAQASQNGTPLIEPCPG